MDRKIQASAGGRTGAGGAGALVCRAFWRWKCLVFSIDAVS